MLRRIINCHIIIIIIITKIAKKDVSYKNPKHY